MTDAETFLDEFARGSEAIGLPTPPPEMERLMVDALDYFAVMRSDPLPERSAVWAWWRGVLSAVRSENLGESLRLPTKRMERAWDRGRYFTHRVTLRRFDRWHCTWCGAWVRGPGKAHDPGCRQFNPPPWTPEEWWR